MDLGKVVTSPASARARAPRRFWSDSSTRRGRDRAADKLLKNAYLEALEESKLEPYAAADVEIVSFEIGEALVLHR